MPILTSLAAALIVAHPAPAPAVLLAVAPKPAAIQPRVPAPAPVATPAPVSPLPSSAAGIVRDAQTNEPISGVLVQQEGAVTSVFTQPDGTFRVLLERGAGNRLTISGVGYDAVNAPIGDGQNVNVKLTLLAGFVPSAPLLPNVPIGQSTADTAPLNTGLIFAYRLREQTTASGAASYSGLISNDFRLGARFRLRPYLIDAEGSHNQTGIDVTGLDRSANPAFRPSTYQAGLRVGALMPLFSPDLEIAGQLGYRWTNTVPNNADVPYTGSPLDWEQTRHALGPVATIAWRPGRGKFHAEGSVGYYGVVASASRSLGTPFANQSLLDTRAILGYELVPGMRLGLGYQYDNWMGNGNGSDTAHIGSLQLHYTPGGAPKGNEP